MTGLDPADLPDVDAFLARLVRLDRSALVRLRPAGGVGVLAVWARLPFGVLVTRHVRAALTEDVTVRAAALLRALHERATTMPARVDAGWRWPLPPGAGAVVERLPAAEIDRLGVAAGSALRTAVAGGVAGRAVGERMLRDALLDHVPVVVLTEDGARVEVSQRLVQGVVRMGFLGPRADEGKVDVRVAGGWVGLAAEYGAAWRRLSTELDIRPVP